MDLEIDAAEIRIRAERRLGAMITEQKEGDGLNTGAMGIGKSAVPQDDRTPTLADVGIDKNLSSRAQKLASVPDETFEGMMGEWHERVNQENERVKNDVLQPEAHDVLVVSGPETIQRDESAVLVRMVQRSGMVLLTVVTSSFWTKMQRYRSR